MLSPLRACRPIVGAPLRRAVAVVLLLPVLRAVVVVPNPRNPFRVPLKARKSRQKVAYKLDLVNYKMYSLALPHGVIHTFLPPSVAL